MNIKKNSCYTLFKNILITKGFNRNLLFDFQRENIYFVPDTLIEIISKEKIIYDDIILEFCKNDEDKTIINEYFSFLQNNEMIFEINENLIGNFPKISEVYEEPCFISNMVIDIDIVDLEKLSNLLIQMEKLLCYNLEIRFYNIISIQYLNEILNKLSEFNINNLFLTLKYSIEFTEDCINEMLTKYSYIQVLFFYNSLEHSVVINEESSSQIIHSTKNFSPQKECGNICQNLFNLSGKHYFESINNNTCLNKKISIDIDGNIKNCPSMKNSFGNISDTTLHEVLQNNSFKKIWHVKKDEIDICKDCEFRHICTDCRAYLEIPNNIYSKPLKCGYSPYTNEWEDWSLNPLKQKAIKYYNLK